MRAKRSTKFIVLSTQRSGSTWLIDKLNSHPQIKAYSELLKDDGIGYPKFGELDFPFYNQFKVVNKNKDALKQYLNELYSNGETVGFKLMYNQHDSYPSIIDYVSNNDIKIIHLYRKSILDTYISKVVAAQSQQYHRIGTTESDDLSVLIDIPTFMAFLDKSILQLNKFKKLYKDSLEITYEELISNKNTFKELQFFLGVKQSKLKSSLKKIIKTDKRDLIVNYQEVLDFMYKSDYYKYL